METYLNDDYLIFLNTYFVPRVEYNQDIALLIEQLPDQGKGYCRVKAKQLSIGSISTV
jgi:hypothetical protein